MRIEGRVWLAGDNINTDLILPIQAYYLSVEEQPAWVFSANRPGWSDEVTPGDILVAGRNFGVGSSRPAARSLKNLGLACLLAESINGLFYRNAVNFAFPSLEAPGITGLFQEGETAEIDFDAAEINNPKRGERLTGTPMPPQLLRILKAGGIYPLLQSENLIR
ncbi:MAG: 3-isopropylmalate dehydratase [Alphaproteobacteria bacterium]|jgi:3-isopropylmalate/(R)-2-methylmalate dehydratase small subunit|nr:3-isopropylmalate dehydratase [Alphaproteobacteria bacterium]MDP6829337.1 3-isopropylmalate dehydratase [Alphaproteobacteria bacterium]MDP6873610.1 3-isopropylmalate dehydratase [Alphaproteobacteria bacterium]